MAIIVSFLYIIDGALLAYITAPNMWQKIPTFFFNVNTCANILTFSSNVAYSSYSFAIFGKTGSIILVISLVMIISKAMKVYVLYKLGVRVKREGNAYLIPHMVTENLIPEAHPTGIHNYK